MQDPFQEDEKPNDDVEAEIEDEPDADPETTKTYAESTEPSTAEIREESKHVESQPGDEPLSKKRSQQIRDLDMETPYIKDLDVTRTYSPARLAQALMVPAYHDEDPPVPYSVWRDGTSTGRSRTTIELNKDVDELVKQAMREFNNRYDADIRKADIREFALAYGLAHLDAVFAMAEEWGIQYNS